LFLICP
jgi:hypothetical protein